MLNYDHYLKYLNTFNSKHFIMLSLLLSIDVASWNYFFFLKISPDKMLAFTFAINVSPFCLNFQSRLKIPHFFFNFPFKTEAMLYIDFEWVEALHKGRGQKSVILN